MAGLALTWKDIRDAVSFYLGYGSTAPTSGASSDMIDRIVKAGLRKFYYPVMEEGRPHLWSFLRPVTSINTVASQGDYDLPADFGSIRGEITLVGDNPYGTRRLDLTSEGVIRSMRMNVDSSGVPLAVATQLVKADPANTPQAYILMVWPEPKAVYTIGFRYLAVPAVPGDATIYPHGAALHSQTILEACLSEAEITLKQAAGLHTSSFTAALAASVALDREVEAVDTLGYNRDQSDAIQGTRFNPHFITRPSNTVSYEGAST